MGGLGNALVSLLTGQSADQLQAEAQAAEQQFAQAIEALIVISTITAVATIAIAVKVWKG